MSSTAASHPLIAARAEPVAFRNGKHGGLLGKRKKGELSDCRCPLTFQGCADEAEPACVQALCRLDAMAAKKLRTRDGVCAGHAQMGHQLGMVPAGARVCVARVQLYTTAPHPIKSVDSGALLHTQACTHTRARAQTPPNRGRQVTRAE